MCVSLSVISCEEGKALAESWNAAFMESSAKENQVMMRFLSDLLPLPLVFSEEALHLQKTSVLL